MRAGTVFYERYIKETYAQEHLETLLAQGFSHFEFTLHPKLLSVKTIDSLIQTLIVKKSSISFHAPDFMSAKDYGLLSFLMSHSSDLMLEQFETIADFNRVLSTPYVLHGITHADASVILGAQPTDEEMATINLRSLDKCLNLICQRHLPLEIAFENTAPQDGFAWGQTTASLNKTLNLFQGAPLSLCLDIAHAFRSLHYYKQSSDVFLDWLSTPQLAISHYHLHGISPDFQQSHLPLKASSLSYYDFVKQIHSKKLKKTFVFECFEIGDSPERLQYENVLFQDLQALCAIEND